MEIKTLQEFKIKNVITQRGKFTAKEFEKAALDITTEYKNYLANSGNTIITTTISIEMQNNEQIMDVEIIVPVTKEIKPKHPYQFKKEIKITNALYSKVENPSLLMAEIEKVNKYMQENSLIPITSAYLVQTKQDNLTSIEIYIGINPNIL